MYSFSFFLFLFSFLSWENKHSIKDHQFSRPINFPHPKSLVNRSYSYVFSLSHYDSPQFLALLGDRLVLELIFKNLFAYFVLITPNQRILCHQCPSIRNGFNIQRGKLQSIDQKTGCALTHR